MRSRNPIPTPNAQKPSSLTLSSSTTPVLPPAAPDAATTRTPGPTKSDPQPQNSPRWPVSPRLRSPPRFPDAPAINLPRPALASVSTSPEATAPSDSEAEDYLQSGMRTPVRGASGNVPTLETVQEASPLGPSYAVDSALEKLETASIVSVSDAGISTTPEITEVSSVKTIRARQLASQNAGNESGSENGSAKNSGSTRRAAPPLTSRNSMAKLSTGKGKTGEGSQPTTMTVETETVTSIANVTLGPSTAQGVNGSLRAKPSSETIRPKKEKKKTARKQTPVPSGAATSKADIFEAKVASAVDEANTSDSEETFVYDSNPADARDRPHRFHHSRTPSATSLSQADRSGMRSIHSIMEGGGSSGGGVTVKKSMKFVNTFGNTSGNDSGMGGDDEAKTATVRGATGSGRGTARLHHHVGRFGLGGKNGHQSILDNESLFPVNPAQRLKLMSGGSGSGGNNNNGNNSGPTSYPSGRNGATSPRPSGGSISGRSGTYSQKRGYGSTHQYGYGYDMDDTTPGQAGDDERTPLVGGSVRGSMRGTHRARRHHMSLRALEQQSYQHPPASFLNRFASCLVLTVMLMLVISGAIGFMFATSQPLDDIELVKISNVIASEQELMFDLFVRAHNPNVVVVSVDSADMEVFAKSPRAGSNYEQEQDQDPESAPNFLLGKFTAFDNPLSFEGSFFHHGLSTSRSGVRIQRPGNGTDGGAERWERILEDEFDLIIKGVLRYSLPLSQRVRSALIEGRRTVKPNAVDNPVRNGTVVSDE